ARVWHVQIMKLVLADDVALLRDGLAALLQGAGHSIVGTASDADELRTVVRSLMGTPDSPDVVITDIRMPPNNTNDGLVAAVDLRGKYPGLPVVVLSAYVAGPYVDQLLADSEGGTGYLLKERVGRIEDFLHTLEVVVAGGVVVDPEVVSHLMSGSSRALARLTDRERAVLSLMAEGLSNSQIGDRLVLSRTAVSKHVANIFMKLDLPPGEENRRVRAVLTWLRAEKP
ncbi:response regulator transcription factor, partial [Ancrocorticia populi]|uniref:response regulator transcription factor n=1 Tax=Ancrocorticia populi TaxID=2175228 RepID=UPI003F90609C